jgi:hypothetical protein
MDMRDPLTSVTRDVAGLPFFNGRVSASRQLNENDKGICTLSVLRTAVVCFGEGIAGLQYGNKAVPVDESGCLWSSAQSWSTSPPSPNRSVQRWNCAMIPLRPPPPSWQLLAPSVTRCQTSPKTVNGRRKCFASFGASKALTGRAVAVGTASPERCGLTVYSRPRVAQRTAATHATPPSWIARRRTSRPSVVERPPRHKETPQSGSRLRRYAGGAASAQQPAMARPVREIAVRSE